MKFWKIFRFEFSHQLSSISTWMYLAVLVGFAALMELLVTPGDGVYTNNTFHIISITVIGVFIWLVIAAAIAGEAAARDVQTRMSPLTFTLPVSRKDYLGARFLAALTINALIVLALPLTVLIGFYFAPTETLLPFSAKPYLTTYFFIALPSVFIMTALQFSFATLSRQVMTSYLASILLALFPQVIAIAVANLFGNWDIVKLLDPIGVAGVIAGELRTWTPTEKNTRLITVEGMFLWNRILWMTIAVFSLVVTYVRFNFDNSTAQSWRSLWKKKDKVQREISPAALLRPIPIVVPQVSKSFGFATHCRQALWIAQSSFGKIARGPVGIPLVAIVGVVSIVFGNKILTQFGIPLLPTTHLILDYFAAAITDITSPLVVIPLLIIYFAGQLVWSERDGRVNDIADATPVPEWCLFTGKFFGLVLMILFWIGMLMASGLLMQSSLGYFNFEIGLYLKTLFGLQFLEYLLFALLSISVHAIVNNKKTGHLVMLLVFIFMAFPSAFQIEHNMLVFGAGPRWLYSDLRGFGGTLFPWLCFKLYWISWALLLALIARLAWARGREQDFRQRFQVAKQRFTRIVALGFVISIALLLTIGAFVFYNTNIRNEYVTSTDIIGRKAEYELRYGKYRNTPQPQLVRTTLNIDIYPEQKEVAISARYTLVNKESFAIDSIHVGSISAVKPTALTFDRAASPVTEDAKLGHYIYVLKQPIQPGDSLHFDFNVNYSQQGFRHNGTDELVALNGTFFSNYDLLPFIGYNEHKEIKDAVVRRQYNLPERPLVPSLDDREAIKKPLTTDRNIFDAIISTTNNEVAVAPGNLQRTWSEGNRNYFHFRTDAPIRGEYDILSGQYALMRSKWNDVTIELYYGPQHAMNVDKMLESVYASMQYYSSQFGPYPYRQVTIVERAGPGGGGASAEASMINYGEQFALMNPDMSRNGFDLPYYILAHEVAHQWFGSAQLSPANVEGAGVLIEGLAVYAGIQVLEEKHGQGHVQKYIDYLHSFYEMPRSLASASLMRANDSFLYYRKGGLAMHVMSSYLGREKVNGALRSMLQKHTSGALPLLTTRDLYNEIKAVTPDSLHYLLRDLFETNTYWRLKSKQFDAAQTQNGDWQVTLTVQAQKFIVDSTGTERQMPMNDLLEIGIYENVEDNQRPLYLKLHRVRSGEQVIRVTVPRKPASGGIDPNHLVIDIRRDDNLIHLDD